ncbi:MAG: type 11 methyltransferase [Devosia sp.]|uniref:class I SAM-dependent methyltransferase n=1 Tax=Devosia sp. TaxID=1871048 RepID=UPI00261DAA7D|nr:class I SAM-dependent methyltransferase [Devosia sp.]MDB5526939.1 type 11 methyltransferase [Devosia sp.]
MTASDTGLLDFYEGTYLAQGFGAQRRYPNEELCRFMGRRFFSVPSAQRKTIRVLDAGCGSGANLWMIAREGFDAVGIDLSPAAIELSREMLASYGTKAELRAGDMTSLPFADGSFDAVVDVFSSNCLDMAAGRRFLGDMTRVLKPGGRFFSYFPSKRSDTWTDATAVDGDPEALIDASTLNGVRRKSSPYFGNDYAFRFLHPREYTRLLQGFGFKVVYCETLRRTYEEGREEFEFVVIEGIKS